MDDIKKPLNIWNDIKRVWVKRLDLVFEGQKITGIHHSDFNDIINDIDLLCKKLQIYKNEMIAIYGDDKLLKSDYYTRIYLIFDKSKNIYKIGRSKTPTVRERTLHSESPEWDMIFISNVTELKTEKILHNLFKEKRIRGEWFKLNNDDVNFIKNYNYDN